MARQTFAMTYPNDVMRGSNMIGTTATRTATFTGATKPISINVVVPGDKSISHRALIFAALSNGQCTIAGLSRGADVLATAQALRDLGVSIEWSASSPSVAHVIGCGAKFVAPTNALDFGNSGTGFRLMMGVCAGLDFTTSFVGDLSLSARPMDRVASPLIEMGAHIAGIGERCLAPLTLQASVLHPIEYDVPVPSAQVKSAVLLAGLFASPSPQAPHVVRESRATRHHTEEMLADLCGVAISTTSKSSISGGEQDVITLTSGLPLTPFNLEVPSDPSQAAFWAVAASITNGVVTLPNLYAGAGRLGFVDVLQQAGVACNAEVRQSHGAGPTQTLTVRGLPQRPLAIGASIAPALIDEIPILAVLAACVEGISTFRDVGELRVKETDRIKSTVAMLTTLGVECVEFDDGFSVVGNSDQIFRGGVTIQSFGDHRIAMAGAIAALRADAPVTIENFEAVDTSYPGFEQDWHQCVS